MAISNTDPVASQRSQFPLASPPCAASEERELGTPVSFGYARMRPMPAGDLNLTGVVYDPYRQMLTMGGVPVHDLPSMASHTQRNTTEDHQTWTDSDRD